jgi:flavorubredoxin
MQQIRENVFYCGITDAHRKCFDEIMPLTHGTSYNSYLVRGSEKTALIDTTYPPKVDEYLAGLGDVQIDYIIANHGEQDHTGGIPALLEKFPNSVVLTNQKCKDNIVNMFEVPEDRIQIAEGVSLGDKTLKFIPVPGVHWPDTMFTHLIEDNLLFTCDFLGAHQAFDASFDELAAKKYYAEIMMPFAPMCRKYVQLVRDIAPAAVLPSHGRMYEEPEIILRLYEYWAGVNGKNLVSIPYISMYGSTKIMADYLARELEKRGTKACLYDIVRGDICEFATTLVDASAIVIAVPMVLAGPHPMAAPIAGIIKILRPKAKHICVIGSYGWGGDLNFKDITNLEPVLAKGLPRASDFENLDKLVARLVEQD